jgi:hypothetical protein
MNAKSFKSEVEDLLSDVEDLILDMPDKGTTEEDSQKIVLKQRLNELYQAVNGVEDEDFEEDEE